MCSICGVCNFKCSSMSFLDDAQTMGRTMKSRGPDDTGSVYFIHCALSHNRLSVIDPEGGAQPMTRVFDNKSYTIVYNGEIYNYPELKKELTALGAEFSTNCDTEAVLWSYIFFGQNCAEHLNGIFAFAVFDEDAHTLFLARDRFGIKPLFYAFDGTSFLFASEIKALLAHPNIRPKVGREGIWQLLFMSPVTKNGSGIFEGIYEIEPGYTAVFKDGKLKKTRYWKLTAAPYTKGSAEAAEEVSHLLCDAIVRQLRSDVPLCTFLSGGLDSSVITAVAADYLKKKGQILSTYSFEHQGNKKSFKSTLFQPQGDDEFATSLAAYLGTNHTVLTCPTEREALYLTDAVCARDFPGQADIDSSLYYYCGEVKKSHTVALSGECSDEIFGGYPWFYRPEMLTRQFFPWIHEPFARANLFKEEFAHPKEGYEYASDIYKSAIRDTDVLDTDSEAMRNSRIASRLSQDFFMTSLLERKDRMSMAHGLEVRVPFSDHRIAELVYNIPWEIKFEGGVEKALLRNAMKNFLPDTILWRKKSPYPKTHNPEYERIVRDMLHIRLMRKGFLFEYLDRKALDEMLNAENVTWFGQLMGRPQLIAWLIQFDFWAEKYNIDLDI